MIEELVNEIKSQLKENAPDITEEQRVCMYKILNSDNPNFFAYRLKMADLEKIIKNIFQEKPVSYEDGVGIFKNLVKSDNHDENLAAYFYINGFKKEFNENTIDLFHEALFKYCDTWSLCDSSVIRVIGPFLAKNDELAKKIIENWSNSEGMWVRRASIVILLKVIMIKKSFNDSYLFNFVERMLQYDEDYIQKGIGWLLKTCSKYDPELIYKYLEKHIKSLPRLILRYASEKLPKGKRDRLLKKK